MKRDLFGRTEAELEALIDWEERVLKVSAGYGGNEGAALALAAKKRGLELDRRALAELRGEVRSESVPFLGGAALEKWRKDLVRRGRAGMP